MCGLERTFSMISALSTTLLCIGQPAIGPTLLSFAYLYTLSLVILSVSKYHPAKLYPVFVGFVNVPILLSYVAVLLLTVVPPSVSKLIVYVFGLHFT